MEMLDYDFLDKCVDTGLMRAIVRKLRSGEEGHYPHLLKVQRQRLVHKDPPTVKVVFTSCSPRRGITCEIDRPLPVY